MRKIFTPLIAFAIIVTTVAVSYAHQTTTANAACTALSSTYGETTNTVSVPTAGTYKVWLRVKTTDSTVNAMNVQIDQASCNQKVGGTSLTANTWTWTNTLNGNVATPYSLDLASGSHTVYLSGTGDGMQVDRVVLTANGCVPTGTGDNCTVATTPTVTVPDVTLSASPTTTTVGKTAVLTWSATGSPTSCTATGDWTGAKAASSTFTTPALTEAKTYSYALSCVNAGGTSTTKTATVVVSQVPVPVVSLTVTPGSATIGQKLTLTWSATNNPTSCTSDGYWKGDRPVSGTLTTAATTIATTYSYSLTCTNAGGVSATKTVGVVVTPAIAVPVVTLTASPTSLTVGGTTKLTWSATGSPTSCTATGDWTGTKTASGTFTSAALTTVKDYTYGLTCTNAGGASTTKTVTVTAKQIAVPVVTLSVTPTTATVGSKVTLTWSSTNNATSCTSAGEWSGARATSGTITTGALTNVATYTYSLTCSNAGGASATKTVTSVMTAAPVVVTYLPADINKDRVVSILDWSLFQVNYGKTGTGITTARADINGDGKVNLLDFSTLAKQFGEKS